MISEAHNLIDLQNIIVKKGGTKKKKETYHLGVVPVAAWLEVEI